MAKPGGSSGGLTYKGTRGNDWISVSSNDVLARTSYDGAAGNDTLYLGALTQGVSIMLNTATSGSSVLYPNRGFTGVYWGYSMSVSDPGGRLVGTIKNVENLTGTNQNDFLHVQSGSTPKVIDGGGGNDALGSNGGNSTTIGGAGSDWLLAYWSNNVMVGGTYAGGVATGDGELDHFCSGGSIAVLDFEIGIDRLHFEVTSAAGMDAYLAAAWQDGLYAGQQAAILAVNGKTVTLVGLTAAQASTLVYDFTVGGEGGVVSGGAGDDIYYPYSSAARLMFGSGSGDDVVVNFSIGNHVLVFDGGAPDDWVEVLVNGAVGLMGTYDNGQSSVTIMGLTEAHEASLRIEETGVPAAPPLAPMDAALFA